MDLRPSIIPFVLSTVSVFNHQQSVIAEDQPVSMEGLIPCIYRAVIRKKSDDQICHNCNILSAAEDSGRGRSFGRDVYNNNTRLPSTADSRSCGINAPQEVLLKPPDRYSLSKSLHRWAHLTSPSFLVAVSFDLLAHIVCVEFLG